MDDKARTDPVGSAGAKCSPTSSDAINVPETKQEIVEVVNDIQQGAGPSAAMRRKVADYYGCNAVDETIEASVDVQYILDRIVPMTEEEALGILRDSIRFHKDDPNFPSDTMARMRRLVLGRGASQVDSEAEDYELDLKTLAAIIHYHSPYPEVRSVTAPGDDPSTPVETFRAYLLGLVFMGLSSAVNTFFSPRQPSISISSQVMQLALAPCGKFLAKFLPDWGVTVRGTRCSLNPGPWSYKEQMFATIIFTIAHGAGGVYYIYLVQRLPQYLGNTWVTFSYEIVLALATQLFGLGFAGLLRRFVVYPVSALFPKVFPTLALNRALVLPERKEVINGWRLSRYRFFLGCFALMFTWSWVPNFLFRGLHIFNWMTWIAPQNFTLGMITGSYGGMGYNPFATWNWNLSGSGSLVTPFYSAVQQYAMRVVSGLIIIGMYWGNMYWSAYMPINSNEGESPGHGSAGPLQTNAAQPLTTRDGNMT